MALTSTPVGLIVRRGHRPKSSIGRAPMRLIPTRRSSVSGAFRSGSWSDTPWTPERSPKTLLRRRWRLLCPCRREPPTKGRSKKPFANGATLAARPGTATKNSSALDFDSPMPAFLITKSNTRSPSSLNTPTPPRIDGGTSPMSCVVFVGGEDKHALRRRD